MDGPKMNISSTVLGAPDPRALAGFYEKLLGWTRVRDEVDWVMLKPPEGFTGLAFQTEEHHVPPATPSASSRTS